VANSGDFATLDRMIAMARSMATLAQDAAPIAARYVETSLRTTAAAGQAPDGTPWSMKKDGGHALKNAAAAISVKAVGTVLLVILRGHHVYHHFGAGVPRRQIIPQGSMPAKLGNAIRLGFAQPWKERTKR
jgi:hypothetical protein